MATLSREPLPEEKELAVSAARQEPRGRRAERAMGAAEPGGVSLQLLKATGDTMQAQNRFRCDALAPRPAALRRTGTGGRHRRRRVAAQGARCGKRREDQSAQQRAQCDLLRDLRRDQPCRFVRLQRESGRHRKISMSARFRPASTSRCTFFPRMEKIMDRVAMVRSFVSHEEVHLRGQYYVQAGRQLNVAFAREIPSIGSVVARTGIAPPDVRYLSNVRLLQSRDQPGRARSPPASCRRSFGLRSESRRRR